MIKIQCQRMLKNSMCCRHPKNMLENSKEKELISRRCSNSFKENL